MLFAALLTASRAVSAAFTAKPLACSSPIVAILPSGVYASLIAWAIAAASAGLLELSASSSAFCNCSEVTSEFSGLGTL